MSKLGIIKREWPVIVAAVLAYVIPGIISAMGSPVVWWGWLLITLGIACTVYIRIHGLTKYREWTDARTIKATAENRAVADEKIKDILQIIINAVLGKVSARANVMLIDENQQLYIAYQKGMEGAPDLNLRWEKYVGSCGDAWGSGRQRIADLDSVNEETLEITWKMDAEHQVCTSKVKSIISTPLRDIDNPDIIIGVLNCDSCEVLSASRLNEDGFRLLVHKYAELIAGFLKLGQLVKKEGNDGEGSFRRG